MNIHPYAVQRFFHYVQKTDDCWLWIGGTQDGGYGAFSYKRVQVRAHRFSWMMHKGEIPTGMFVLHDCDNPRCVNPVHLFLGTQQDNLYDCLGKGRLRPNGRVFKATPYWIKRRKDQLRRAL